jgi:hypothetical protein
VITQALRASASLIGASAPAISETPPKCRNQPNRSFADHLTLNADPLLDVFGSLLMLALSKKTGIHRLRAYGQSLIPIVWRIEIRFPRAAVALLFAAPIFWTGSKISQIESCQQCAGPLVSLLNPAVPGNLPFGSLLAFSICRQRYVDACSKGDAKRLFLCRSRVHSGVPPGTRNRFNGVWRSTKGRVF